jgi:hypothetical protein
MRDVTLPNQLGVEFNARILEAIAKDIKPALGSPEEVGSE